MNTITCAADVKKAFPDADIGSDGIFSNSGGIFLNCDAENKRMAIDGELSPLQIHALSYWLTHLDEFTDSTK
jgi:hypothetical protein